MTARTTGLSALAALTILLAPLPATADGDGVPVFHDRVVKRDPAGDVVGDSTTDVDLRRVTWDHYKLGDNERLVVTARFAEAPEADTTVRWGTSTGAGGHTLEFRWRFGERPVLTRAGESVPVRGIRRSVDGAVVTITVPWRKLGSPARLVGLHFWAEASFGVDQAFKDKAVLR